MRFKILSSQIFLGVLLQDLIVALFFFKAVPFSPLYCFYLLPATSTINGFPSLCIFTVSSLQNVHDGLSHWCRVIPHYALDSHTSLIDHDVQQFGYFLKQCDKNLQLKVFFFKSANF